VKNRLLLVIVGATVLIAVACGSSSKSASRAVPSPGAPFSAAGGARPVATGGASTSSRSGSSTLGATVTPAGPKIVSTADVAVRVKAGSLARVFSAVAGLATGAGGYVSDSTTSFAGDDPNARVVLRVPADQFQAVVARLASLGTVTSESLSGRDVTTEVADNGAQLSTLQDEAEAARTLLARATSIGAILSIQDQVFGLQSQIQQLSAQQAALADEVSYGTLSVELTAVPVPSPGQHHRGTLDRTGHLAVSNSSAVLKGIVLTLGWLTPLLILGVVVALPTALWWRRRQHRRPAAGVP
jgi:hypothetical protein